MEEHKNKIGLLSLVGIIIGSVVGAGVFNLMKEIASTASVGVTIIGWVITGIGMGSLAFCMQNLNIKRPDLNSGIFSYAQEGFGDYIGFNAVWGYWISVIVAIVAFGTLSFSALSYFFPVFGNGQNVASIIGASAVLWAIHFAIARGLDKAAILNTTVLIAKLVPILIFIVFILAAFNKEIFFQDFWGSSGNGGMPLSIIEQLKGTVLATVWVFIGIEGAVVFSGRAKKRSDVGKATLIGFASVTILYASITVFSFGIMSQEELKSLPNPAMAHVLEAVIGKPGAIIINAGVIISIFGAWIAITLLAEEVAFRASKRSLFPKIFLKENKNSVPINSLLITNIISQIMLLSFLVTTNAYSVLSQLSSATILLPYACVALFQLKINKENKEPYSSRNMITGIIASIYIFWVIYASGIEYLILTILALCPATILYIYVKRKNQAVIFEKYEWPIFAIVVLLFIYGLLNITEIMNI